LAELTFQIFIIFVLLLANGLFAMSELAIVAARKVRLQQLAEAGDKRARAALRLAQAPNQFLATVQVGITLVGILAGAFGGATIAEKMGAALRSIPLLGPYSDLISVIVVVIIITYFSLVIGELVPKRLALNNSERIATLVAGPMQFLAKMTRPVVHLLDRSTDLFIRLLGIKPSAEPAITLEEFKVLIEQGTESGVFEAAEQDMIENVLRLDERPVGAWMTPRPKIVWLEIDEPPESIQQKVIQYRHSRFPVAQDNLDNVIGVVWAKDLLVQSLSGNPLDLKVLLHPPLFIPESMTALTVLELFKQQGSHLALVTDEYGGIEGMVTHNDILEDVVGNIPMVGQAAAEPQAIKRADGSWLVDGLLDIDTLNDILGIKLLPEDRYRGFHTVAGFFLSQVHTIPKPGQSFEWQDLRFEVADMDGRRIDKVLVTRLA
jgi:putative hemolysin